MSTASPAKLEQLADALAPLIADRLAEVLAEREQAPSPEWIDAAEAARRLGLTRGTVYELADQLGARRIGDGPRPRLRFPADQVAAHGATAAEPSEPNGNGRDSSGSAEPKLSGRRRRSDLLPIKGAK